MFGDAKMKNPSALMLDHEEHEQYPQPDRRHREEIDGNDFSEMISQKGLPGLRRWPPDGLQDSRNGTFGNGDSQLE